MQIENAGGSRKAWFDLVATPSKYSTLLNKIMHQVKAVDPAATLEKIDVGFGPEWRIVGSNFSIRPSQRSLFVEVYKTGRLGRLARAGIDEPEGYE